jgi:hypothetical protein
MRHVKAKDLAFGHRFSVDGGASWKQCSETHNVGSRTVITVVAEDKFFQRTAGIVSLPSHLAVLVK